MVLPAPLHSYAARQPPQQQGIQTGKILNSATLGIQRSANQNHILTTIPSPRTKPRTTRPLPRQRRPLHRLQHLGLAEEPPHQRRLHHAHAGPGQGHPARARRQRHSRHRLHRHRQDPQLPHPHDPAHGRELGAQHQGQARSHPRAHPAADARARHAGA